MGSLLAEEGEFTTLTASSVDDIKLRPIHCELNPLTRSDGSAYFSQGNTCVLASMIGPVEVRAQHFKVDRAHVDCSYRPKAGLPTCKDKLLEALIMESCESAMLTSLYPRTKIAIQVQELDNRSGLEACAINGACLALLIGGIAMRYTIAALHCIVDKDNKLVLDPDHQQAAGKRGSFLFVFDSLDQHLVTVHTEGRFKLAQFNDAEFLCRAASENIFKFYRTIMTNFHKKSLLLAQKPAKTNVKDEPMDEQ